MAAKKELLTPGQKAPRAGTYEVVGARGAKTGRTANAKRGGSLPPTPKKGQKYVFMPKAKPKAKAKAKPKATKKTKKTARKKK